MSRFGDDAKVAYHDGTTSDEQCAEDHPWREHIAEEKAGKERVPEE